MGLMTTKMPSFNGVAAGQTASVRITQGWSYHQFLLAYSGVTLAQINEIRQVINGDVYRRWVGADLLDAFGKFDGRAAAAGVLTLECRRTGLKNRNNQDITVIGTGMPRSETNPVPVNTMQFEVDIDAAAAAPVLSMKARHSGPSATGAILQIRRKMYTAPGAGQFEISDLHQRGETINRIFFMTAQINELEIKRNHTSIFQRLKAENSLVQSDGARTPDDAAMFVFDPSEEGFGLEFLETAGAQELQFYLDMAAGATFAVYIETIGPLKK